MREPKQRKPKSNRLMIAVDTAASGAYRPRPGRARDRFSHEFLMVVLADFREHGAKTIGRVRQSRPDVYLKVCTAILPKEMTVTSVNLSSMTNEELEQYLAYIRELTAMVRSGLVRPVAAAPMIDGEVVGAENDRDPGEAV